MQHTLSTPIILSTLPSMLTYSMNLLLPSLPPYPTSEAVVRQVLEAHATMGGPEPLPTDDDVTIIVKVGSVAIIL